MPKRTYLTKKEKLPGHKPMKDSFCTPNTAPLIQPMDQQVISNFKKLYTKALFQRCFEVTSDKELTLREFWKNHFNILCCLHLIDKAWRDVFHRTVTSAREKLWPDAVLERVFEDVEEDAPGVEDVVSLGKSMGLEVSSDDDGGVSEGPQV
ncbi:hypothetical protein mRhiFer1_009915 [Rhinolophus ferrumequinum]|uniref:DDE-1 domain-containing protein n=1 Tax=Rhinolophus ferrumequinum TaxID=59479 RepID=A0A7J7YIK7_RHIFE|nr:hypothetical protein mRhiFer1_009915 [Rhinolophus ferrumequinum]